MSKNKITPQLRSPSPKSGGAGTKRQTKEYLALIEAKRPAVDTFGFDPSPMNAAMKPHQLHATEFALRQGRAALFLDTGLGKSFCAHEWGRQVVEKTGKPVLLLAPLAVSAQHEREGQKFGIDVKAIREPMEVRGARIYVTNYDRLEKFDPGAFGGVILDESSILKSFNSKTTKALTEGFARTPYRLACTATPAPNDHMELGTHSEFLGVMRQNMMLQRWFIHDSMDTGTWRMKGHAVDDFWSWVASWSRCISKPSDIGFSDDGYALPELDVRRHVIAADRNIDAGAEKDGQGHLFRMPDTSATSIHREKRMTTDARSDAIADIVGGSDEAWVVWCDTDYEADALASRLPDAVEVRGSMSADEKERGLVAFSTGQVRVIITKPSIAGFGLNWQHCARMAFVGLSFSYENYYQAIRRCWRFGQTRPVQVHIACADTEENIWQTVSRKADDHDTMKRAMSMAMARAVKRAAVETYKPTKTLSLPTWMTS